MNTKCMFCLYLFIFCVQKNYTLTIKHFIIIIIFQSKNILGCRLMLYKNFFSFLGYSPLILCYSMRETIPNVLRFLNKFLETALLIFNYLLIGSSEIVTFVFQKKKAPLNLKTLNFAIKLWFVNNYTWKLYKV